MALTTEQKVEYLLRDGGYCPYCGSDELQSINSGEYEYMSVLQHTVCLRCSRRWIDIYRLHDIEEIPDDKG
jgi:transcriptional regulator NrdR family protein